MAWIVHSHTSRACDPAHVVTVLTIHGYDGKDVDVGFSLPATIAVAARLPVALSTLENVSGIASSAIRMPIPSAGSPIVRKSGVSMMNAPRGIPGATNVRNKAAKAISAS